MAEHREELLAKNFSLTILGKGGGRRDAAIVEVPQELIEAGLLRHYAELPFQVGAGWRGLGLLAEGWGCWRAGGLLAAGYAASWVCS